MIPPYGLEPARTMPLLKRRRIQMEALVNETRRKTCVNWHLSEKKHVHECCKQVKRMVGSGAKLFCEGCRWGSAEITA
jgi:hypothetical protein